MGVRASEWPVAAWRQAGRQWGPGRAGGHLAGRPAPDGQWGQGRGGWVPGSLAAPLRAAAGLLEWATGEAAGREGRVTE